MKCDELGLNVFDTRDLVCHYLIFSETVLIVLKTKKSAGWFPMVLLDNRVKLYALGRKRLRRQYSPS